MLATDILLSIAIVGIYTLVHVYLRTNYNDKKKILIFICRRFYNCNNYYWYIILPYKAYCFIKIKVVYINFNLMAG